MTGSRELTEAQRRRVQAKIQQLLQDLSEKQLEAESGIKQPTLNAAKNVAKVGYKTAEKLATYLGCKVDDLLNGTETAGFYSAQEMKYPNRGLVLDGLSRILPAEVIDGVRAVELPAGVADWTKLEWLKEATEQATRWERFNKGPVLLPTTNGVPPGQHPTKK